jgi:hypothetical protein
VNHALIFVLSVLGFALLLASMARHQRDWVHWKLSSRTSRTLGLAGFLLLALGFMVAGMAFGWAYGAVTWFGWLIVGAGLTVTANTNRERLQRMIGQRRP